MTGPVERMQLGGTVKPTVCPVGLSGADLALMIGRQAARRNHAMHVGMQEPSLMMPGITISFPFNKQGRLVFRTVPL